MTFLVERLAELRKHLDHLRELRPRVRAGSDLEDDLSLHNDVLFSLLMVTQLVIDITGELVARHGIRAADYTEGLRNLARLQEFPEDLVRKLTPLAGFRNVLVHEYVTFDLDRAAAALENLQPVEDFFRIVADMETRDE